MKRFLIAAVTSAAVLGAFGTAQARPITQDHPIGWTQGSGGESVPIYSARTHTVTSPASEGWTQGCGGESVPTYGAKEAVNDQMGPEGHVGTNGVSHLKGR